jgi:squalene-hopene/tetraprenyl-beta-curcumene cyclase
MNAIAAERTGAMQDINAAINEVVQEFERLQSPEGYWVFELEADCTIPAEFIMLNHYLDEINDEVERKLANYLRAIQGKDGGWPLFHDGEMNISATVKGYYALKLVGDDINAPHMKKAREAILAAGGAAKANVFTRIALALFGQVPWRAVPMVRAEAMLLPKWFPFHIDKVSYWSRTVMVPLMILFNLKPKAKNPRNIDVQELFLTPPNEEKNYHLNPLGSFLGDALLVLDSFIRLIEPLFPKGMEKKAIQKAVDFIVPRLNGEDGLGAIFPAMANARMAFGALGYPADHEYCQITRQSVDKLLVFHDDWGYCQPCVSPVWDTGLAAHALMEAGVSGKDPMMVKAMDWLKSVQILDMVGDWEAARPGVRPGGWAFQYRNDYYPDVDDTAVVVMALDRADHDAHRQAVDRGIEWVDGMQSGNGGWGAFDADNESYHLNHIPFADHGALLDPPTVDVSARCIGMLAQAGVSKNDPRLLRALEYLRQEQEPDGSWFGRWGTNYVYGTWSALCAFNAAGEDMKSPHIKKAVEWLKAYQQEDGGWGEDCATYWKEHQGMVKESTPSQTAWAVLALMAAGEVKSEAVRRGIDFILKHPRKGLKWQEELYTAVGFPRVFYLRYHGYSAYFPLWALARYRNLTSGNAGKPLYGI